MAFRGQTDTQLRHEMHLLRKYARSGSESIPSGFWHQRQESVQPFRKMEVRSPGPSWRLNLRMSKTCPRTTYSAPYAVLAMISSCRSEASSVKYAV